MLISLFNIVIALADDDYIMMMIPLMALYNMGEGEWEIPLLVSCTLLHYRIYKYWNILIVIYSPSYILILPVICRLYDYCMLGSPYTWNFGIQRNKEFHSVAISIPRNSGEFRGILHFSNNEEFRGIPRDSAFVSNPAGLPSCGPVILYVNIRGMPATARTYRNKIEIPCCFLWYMRVYIT